MRAAEGVGPYMGCCLEANNPILLQPQSFIAGSERKQDTFLHFGVAKNDRR